MTVKGSHSPLQLHHLKFFAKVFLPQIGIVSEFIGYRALWPMTWKHDCFLGQLGDDEM